MSFATLIDGELLPPEAAKVSIFDRGFLYGDSVFETLRTYGGRAYALGEHLARLEWSATRVFIELPVSREVFAVEVERALAAVANSESFIRVMVTRGRAESLGLDPALAGSPTRVIIVGPLQTPPAEAYEQGVAVTCYRTQRLADATDAAGAKVGNYLIAVLAQRAAKQAGAAESLIVDARGHVIEGANSNLFAVIGQRLVTPPEDAGILPGITRARVIEVARELALPVELRPLTVDELIAAEEAFVSSTIREVLPVVRVDGATIADGRPGAWTRRLLDGFRARVRATMRGA
jgi:branched-chain amino acid aminotransferase